MLLEAPILSAPVLTERAVVIVRAEGDVMAQLLAHAPDEFGGESLAGEPIELTGDKLRTVPGLEDKSVRTISTCR